MRMGEPTDLNGQHPGSHLLQDVFSCFPLIIERFLNPKQNRKKLGAGKVQLRKLIKKNPQVS